MLYAGSLDFPKPKQLLGVTTTDQRHMVSLSSCFNALSLLAKYSYFKKPFFSVLPSWLSIASYHIDSTV